MAPPHHPNSNKPPFIFNPAGTEKHARFEDVPDEDMPSGRRKNIFGELPQPQRKAQHSHPSGEGHRVPVHQPMEGGDHANSLNSQRGNATQKATQGKKPEKKSQGKAPAETHEQFSAPGVGATPQAVGVFLHTSTNPTMALGHTQGDSTLPYQATAQAVPGANIATPSNCHTYYHLVSQDPSPGANLALNTTYIGARNMTYARDNGFQHGAPHNPQGLHFQPPVPDTTYGPMTHTYVPRHDGGTVPQVTAAGGPVQVPLQPQVTPSHTLTVHHQTPVPTFQPQVASRPAVYFGGQTMPGSYPVQVPPMYAAAPAFPGSATAHLPPDVTGVGKTIAEIQAHHHDIAMTNSMHEPEDFQPASKDPAKMYYCRELDGNWTQRSRYSIDKMGDWRWYQTPEGVFYAVRLPN